MSPLPRYAVVLNVPTAVLMTVEANTEQEACEQALAQFLARPRLSSAAMVRPAPSAKN